MYTQAATTTILGQTVFTYGLYLAIACLLSGIMLLHRTKGSLAYKSAASLTCLIAPLLGLLFSRLVYVLFEVGFAPFLTLTNAMNLRLGGLSMFGALLGIITGALISAKLTKVKARDWLNMITPSIFLFIAIARLGEQYTNLGISRPLVTGVLDQSFLALRDEYDAYLRTYLLESIAAFALCISSLVRLSKKPKAPDTFLFGALLFGTTQTFLESLRFDAHIRFSFISFQHVLSALLFCGVLVYASIRLLKSNKAKRLAIASLCMIPLLIGAIVGLEFMIDRSQVNKWLSYFAYASVLLIPTLLGLRMLNIERTLTWKKHV